MAPGLLNENTFPETSSLNKTLPKKQPSLPNDANTEDYARSQDSADPLRSFRDKFIIPTKSALKNKSITGSSSEDDEAIYFCGNSLGLQPKCTSSYITTHLQTWSSLAVTGHFTQPANSPLKPWQNMADFAAEQCSRLVGAKPEEVAIANTLTVNLHLLMASFYRPEGKKCKILLEKQAFPSDHYAIESQIQWHGYNPKEAMILLEPDQDYAISTEHIIATIDKHADEIALVLLPGIQYYTGQFFDIARITAHAHSKGLLIGWDCAHAAGNVPLKLHDWDVDFAAWCTYKYMNAGPGSISGMFVHDRHGKVEYPEGEHSEPVFRHRLTGWYSGDKASRFNMDNNFRPIPGAGGFQISNPSAIDLACLSASLSVFNETSIDDLRQKAFKLTGYLQHLLLKDSPNDKSRPFQIITPLDPAQRGTQLSLLLRPGLLENVASKLAEAGIVVDQRKPDVIRVAPVPLYNTFHDVWRFVQVFGEAVGL